MGLALPKMNLKSEDTERDTQPDTRSLLQKFCSLVLEQGEMPRHIAIIMDGNRRFEKSGGLEKFAGHYAGLQKFQETLRWGSEIRIEEITVFAFSIENFKRSPEEQEQLFKLFEQYLKKTLENIEEAVEEGLCIQLIGDWNLVPPHLKSMMAKVMLATRHGTKRLNIAFAYTGRNDILRGVQALDRGVLNGDILIEDVSEYLLEQAFQLIPRNPVDILLRTSGETRLSDFMMWDCTHAHIHFIVENWPEFSYWNLLGAFLQYQVHRRHIKTPKPKRNMNPDSLERSEKYIQKIRNEQWAILKSDAAKFTN